MTSEEGTYFVQSSGTEETCGIYVVADPDIVIDISLKKLSIDCNSGGLISVSNKSQKRKTQVVVSKSNRWIGVF